MHLICGDKTLDLSRPCVMGVLNVTPDSFSDGGRFHDIGQALAHAHRMIDEGAAIIDIGGESTRPGSNPVDVDEELRRVLPLVRSLARKVSVPISVDTTKPQVMQAVIDAGAGMINDVLALRTPGALEVVAASNAAACLMHMQGEPRTMQVEPHYQDVMRRGSRVPARTPRCLRGCGNRARPARHRPWFRLRQSRAAQPRACSQTLTDFSIWVSRCSRGCHASR